MSLLPSLLLLVLTSFLLLRGARSQATADDCIEIEQINTESSINVLPGVVCIQCVLSGSLLGTGAGFLLGNNPFSSDQASVIDGVLVISNTSAIFNPTTRMIVRCFNSSNAVVQNQADVALEVYAPPIITGESTVNEGNTLMLDCDSRNSLNNPVVQWFDPQNNNIPLAFQTLTISNMNRGQAGTYTCKTAPPPPGVSKTSSVEVIVQYAPDVVAERQDLVDVPVGGTLTISCTYQSIPPPNTVTWRHNDTTTLDPGADQRIDITSSATRTTLTITDITEDEGGSYECIPQNIVGNNTASTDVRIQLPPGPVTGLQVVPGTETTTSLSISWINPEFNGFSEISQFRARFTSRRDPFEVPFDGDVNTITRTFSNLSPFTNYTIELFVRNEVQLEGDGVTTNGMTLSLLLPRVEQLGAEALNSTAISVTWMEPVFNSDTTAPVDSYSLTYELTTGGSSGFLNLPATDTSTVLSDLLMGRPYRIIVTGVNSAGDGASMTAVESTDIDPPGPPENVRAVSSNPFSMTLSWEAPTINGGRDIVRYNITITDNERATTEAHNVQATSRTMIFTNLNQNTSYTFVIQAVNSDEGEERFSSPVMITNTTLPVGPPLIPDPLFVVSVSNVSVSLSWNNPGNFPDNYTVQIKNVVDNWPGIETAGIRNTVHVQNGLTPLTSYEVRVLSININGPSDFSSSIKFKTVGMVKVDGGEGEVNGTLDATSGETVTLNCSLELLNSDNSSIDYTWTRQDGSDLPELSSQIDGLLTINQVEEDDSGVYVCMASGVEASFTLTVMEPTTTDTAEVSTVVIIVVAVIGGIALIIFLLVLACAIYCVCFRDAGGVGNSPHKRTFSFRSKHWADTSGRHSMPRENQQDTRKDMVQSFHIPDDYTGTSSFDTANRVNRDSPSSTPKNTHAGAEPTTSFQLQPNNDNTVL